MGKQATNNDSDNLAIFVENWTARVAASNRHIDVLGFLPRAYFALGAGYAAPAIDVVRDLRRSDDVDFFPFTSVRQESVAG